MSAIITEFTNVAIALVAFLAILFVIEMVDMHMKIRKFQRTLAPGTNVKYLEGPKWRFGEVKSVHGELIHVWVDGGLEWVKRGSLWPIQRWDRHDTNIQKS